MTDIKETMRKVLALAKAGAPGERDAAQAVLDSLMEKHGVTADELHDESAEHTVTLKHKRIHHDLAMLVAVRVLDRVDFRINNHRKTRTVVYDVTRTQAVEIEATFSIYKKRFDEDLATFSLAFLSRNSLLIRSELLPDTRDEPDPELVKRHEKAARMARGMDRHQIRKGITEQKGD